MLVPQTNKKGRLNHMKNKTLWKILALVLAVGSCAAFIFGSMNSASAETGTELVSSATQKSRTTTTTAGTALVDPDELFTERDLAQEPDLSGAATVAVLDGQNVSITEEGVYVLTGTAENVTVTVDADGAKVQLVLDGLQLTNSDFPCLYVKSADKVFVTTVADSSLTVTGSFLSDGDTNTDAVIFSKDDLVLNGAATLTISSSENGVSSKDDLKVTGGTYVITAASKCLEAKDSVRIAGGSFTLKAGSDGIHAENDDDDSLGWVYIADGAFTIDAGDDGIHAKAFVRIDGGSFTISAAEGVEATTVQINGGTIAISSWDDGINAARKSTAYAVLVEINGGELTIAMSAGDTDGIDSNGSITVNGGTITITGNSSFDYDGTASYNGGTIIVNGQTLSYIPNQMMGGGMGGQMGGQMGGMGGRRGR